MAFTARNEYSIEESERVCANFAGLLAMTTDNGDDSEGWRRQHRVNKNVQYFRYNPMGNPLIKAAASGRICLYLLCIHCDRVDSRTASSTFQTNSPAESI